MWVFLKHSFLSIVDKSSVDGCLMVRARRSGDIERVFPAADVRETPGNDYLFRADVPRKEVAARIAEYIMEIDAPNFKASVKDKPLHDAYMGVWSVMGRLQPGGPYGHGRGRGQGRLL